MKKRSWLAGLMLLGAVALWNLPAAAVSSLLADCGCGEKSGDGGGNLLADEHEDEEEHEDEHEGELLADEHEDEDGDEHEGELALDEHEDEDEDHEDELAADEHEDEDHEDHDHEGELRAA